jgi:hypothetical protein
MASAIFIGILSALIAPGPVTTPESDGPSPAAPVTPVAPMTTAAPVAPATSTSPPPRDYLFRTCERVTRKAEQEQKEAKAKNDAKVERLERRQAFWCDRFDLWAALEQRIDDERGTFRGAMAAARDARCKTAICWGPSNRWGIEPLAELPIGKTFAVTPSGLGKYINSSGISVRFNAGLRFWWAWDWVSAAVYFATPDLANKETIVISGSPFRYPVSQIRRPIPGFALGFFGDTLWVGLDYDQLRNGGAETTRDERFPTNEIVSHALSITIAVAPVAGFRNGIGTLVEANRKKDEIAAERKQAAADRAKAEQERAKAEQERKKAEEEREKAAEEREKAAEDRKKAEPSLGDPSPAIDEEPAEEQP